MAKVLIRAGAEIDVPTRAEVAEDIHAAVRDHAGTRERETARGVKLMDIPLTLSGKVASTAITLGPANGQICGPELGYIWSVMALVVTGLGASDTVNLYINDVSRPIFWQFNGTNFGYTFSRGQRIIRGGESFALQNSGALGATGTITLSGQVWQLPQEMQAKLL